MNWEAIGVFAEVIGAIGVIATLVYLTIEVRKNTAATRQQSYHDFVSRRSEWLESISSDREKMEIFMKGVSGEQLDHIDSQRFLSNMLKLMSHLQDVYLQQGSGIAESKVWNAESRLIGAFLEQPGFANWWEETQQYYLPEFVAEVSNIEPINPVIYTADSGRWSRPGGRYSNIDGNPSS